MPHWLIKSAIHRAISVLPGSQKWNELFQKYVTKSLELSTGEFEGRLKSCRQCLEDFLAINPEGMNGFTALELGTGWYPTIPLGLYLSGATEIWSFDIAPLLRRERLQQLLRMFCEYSVNGKLQALLPFAQKDRIARLAQLAGKATSLLPEQLLNEFNIHTVIRDARETGLKPKSIDLCFSYSVLEYVPAPIQETLYREFHRLASSKAAIINFINIKDQYCSFDKTITPLNCLKYSSSAWKWLNSPLIPQTRLRISDYRKLLRGAGFEVVKEVSTRAPLADLEKIQIAPEFQSYEQADLLVISSWLVARPAQRLDTHVSSGVI